MWCRVAFGLLLVPWSKKQVQLIVTWLRYAAAAMVCLMMSLQFFMQMQTSLCIWQPTNVIYVDPFITITVSHFI